MGLVHALAACGDNIDEDGRGHGLEDKLAEWLTSNGAVLGTVYACKSGAVCLSEEGEPTTEEYCYWEDSAAELSKLVGGPCHEIEVGERLFPALAGCAYACPLLVRGCNAHCGCFCPPDDV